MLPKVAIVVRGHQPINMTVTVTDNSFNTTEKIVDWLTQLDITINERFKDTTKVDVIDFNIPEDNVDDLIEYCFSLTREVYCFDFSTHPELAVMKTPGGDYVGIG